MVTVLNQGMDPARMRVMDRALTPLHLKLPIRLLLTDKTLTPLPHMQHLKLMSVKLPQKSQVGRPEKLVPSKSQLQVTQLKISTRHQSPSKSQLSLLASCVNSV